MHLTGEGFLLVLDEIALFQQKSRTTFLISGLIPNTFNQWTNGEYLQQINLKTNV